MVQVAYFRGQFQAIQEAPKFTFVANQTCQAPKMLENRVLNKFNDLLEVI